MRLNLDCTPWPQSPPFSPLQPDCQLQDSPPSFAHSLYTAPAAAGRRTPLCKTNVCLPTHSDRKRGQFECWGLLRIYKHTYRWGVTHSLCGIGYPILLHYTGWQFLFFTTLCCLYFECSASWPIWLGQLQTWQTWHSVEQHGGALES